MEVVLRIGSTSQTIKARRALLSGSVYSRMVKTEYASIGGGCSWGLRIERRDIYTAQRILDGQGIFYEIL